MIYNEDEQDFLSAFDVAASIELTKALKLALDGAVNGVVVIDHTLFSMRHLDLHRIMGQLYHYQVKGTLLAELDKLVPLWNRVIKDVEIKYEFDVNYGGNVFVLFATKI